MRARQQRMLKMVRYCGHTWGRRSGCGYSHLHPDLHCIDAAGNKADPLTRTTHCDQTAPQLVLLGDAIIELSVGDAYVEAGRCYG